MSRLSPARALDETNVLLLAVTRARTDGHDILHPRAPLPVFLVFMQSRLKSRAAYPG